MSVTKIHYEQLVDEVVNRETTNEQVFAGDIQIPNLTVTGDFTVEGTKTILHTNELAVDDQNIHLNVSGDYTSANGGGITLERGVGNDALLIWNETLDQWEIGIEGTTYKILSNNDLIDDDTFGTATSTNVASSESIKAYIDNGLSNSTLSAVLSNGNTTSGTDILMSVGDQIESATTATNYINMNNAGNINIHSEDGNVSITSAGDGVIIDKILTDTILENTLNNGVGIENLNINNLLISGTSTIASFDDEIVLTHTLNSNYMAVAADGEIVLDSTNGKSINMSNNIISNVTDPISLQDAATKKYVDDAVNSYDTLSELNDTLITTPSSGNILIYDGVDSWDNKVMSGEAAIDNTGAVTISDNVIDENNLTVSVAGDGLSGGNGSALSFNFVYDPSLVYNYSTEEATLLDNISLMGTDSKGNSSLMVFWNGQLQRAGSSNDYTVTGNTISFNRNIKSTDVISAWYILK